MGIFLPLLYHTFCPSKFWVNFKLGEFLMKYCGIINDPGFCRVSLPMNLTE